MAQLKLHREEHSELDPIPFPTAVRAHPDETVRNVERSLAEVQAHLDKLGELVESVWRIGPDDDPPCAA